MAVITPTRRSYRWRIAGLLQELYLRWLITHAEKDKAHHERELQDALSRLPQQIDHDQRHIDNLTYELAKVMNER
jgi:hypothetical protein